MAFDSQEYLADQHRFPIAGMANGENHLRIKFKYPSHALARCLEDDFALIGY